MDTITWEVGERIRMYRLQQGMTQEMLAESAELHPTFIGQVERGEKNMSLVSLAKILEALKISFSEFFENVEDCKTSNSIPAKCYQLVRSKKAPQQESLYKILQEIDRLMTS